MNTIRDIVTEALNRANIVSRRQNAPADMVETAYRLLKGIAAKYSNDNLLQFLRSDVTFLAENLVTTIGSADPGIDGDAVDVQAPELQGISNAYIQMTEDTRLYNELLYVKMEDLDSPSYGANIFSWQPISDTKVKFYIRLVLLNLRKPIKIFYNRKWEFNLDSELRVPAQYVELFNCALTHKLAVTYPRLSTDQTTILKTELSEMEQNVMTQNRANKFIRRKSGQVGMSSRESFLSGQFLGMGW